MNHSAVMPFNDAAFALTLGLLLLASLAIAGVALINTGLGRARSAAQSLLGSLGMISVAVIVFALVGATFADGTAGAGHIFHFSGKPWNWCGTGAWFLTGLAGLPARAQLAVLFQCLAVSFAVLIPWGSGADRWRLTAGAAAAAILAAFVFPLSPTGSGAVAGSRSSGQTSHSVPASSIVAVQAASTFSEAYRLSSLFGSPVHERASSHAKASQPRCRGTMPSMFSSGACSRSSAGWHRTWPALCFG